MITNEPCPFCGSERISITMADHGRTYVTCQICLAQGPVMPSGVADAWKAWNKGAHVYDEAYGDGYRDGWDALRHRTDQISSDEARDDSLEENLKDAKEASEP